MKKMRLSITHILVVAVVVFSCEGIGIALPIHEAVQAIADNLVSEQRLDGGWPDSDGFTGSIVAGLVNAYQVTGNVSYKSAAELGGGYIVDSAEGNFYGDEAYALARLTDITGDGTYAQSARDFYDKLDTYAYISGFKQTDTSNAVFYVAQHTVAAAKVGAADAPVWREALIQYLSRVVDDSAYYPVMSLGVATWALAQSGPMDDTRIDPFGLIDGDFWVDVTLGDLPEMLLSYQVDSGPYAGSFYYRFDREGSGYTEDTVFGLLGLISATDYAGRSFGQEILAGRLAMASSIDWTGIASEHIWAGGASYYTYGGEVLQAIPEPVSILLFATAGCLLARLQSRRKSLC